MAFDITKCDLHELKKAYKILDGVLGGLENARLDTLRQNNKLTPNEAFSLALELRTYDAILSAVADEMSLQEKDLIDNVDEDSE